MNVVDRHLMMEERAFVFRIGEDELPGILHPGRPEAGLGVLIVVGGPQYRVGSHRQFVRLARRLSKDGVPVMRFDYRGMGDASGEFRSFEQINEDLFAAINAFIAHSPGIKRVVLWGLCDAASAALDYAWRDCRVSGLVLLNPWVRTDVGLAKAYLRHYYLQRLTSREFWKGLLRGRVNPLASVRSLGGIVGRILRANASGAFEARRDVVSNATDGATMHFDRAPLAPNEPLPVRMAVGWKRFRGEILLVLSGDDLTAAEFRDVASREAAWDGLLHEPRVSCRVLNEANHTFARQAWREQVEEWTLEWLRQG